MRFAPCLYQINVLLLELWGLYLHRIPSTGLFLLGSGGLSHPDEGTGFRWTWPTSLHQMGSSKDLTQICDEQKSQLLWQSLFSSEQTGSMLIIPLQFLYAFYICSLSLSLDFFCLMKCKDKGWASFFKLFFIYSSSNQNIYFHQLLYCQERYWNV